MGHAWHSLWQAVLGTIRLGPCWGGPIDTEETEVGEIASASPLRRFETRMTRIEGTRGYMASEVIAGKRISRRSDMFAFGVVLLELLCGEELVRYRYDRESGGLEMILIIETARRVIGVAEEEAEGAEERYSRVREWVDQRLRDSFPLEAAKKLIRVALRCVEAEAGRRPDMISLLSLGLRHETETVTLENETWGQPRPLWAVSCLARLGHASPGPNGLCRA